MQIDIVERFLAADAFADVRGRSSEVIDLPAVLPVRSASFGVGSEPFRDDELTNFHGGRIGLQRQAVFRNANEKMGVKPLSPRLLLHGEGRQPHRLLAGVVRAKQLGVDLVQDLPDLR